ncbi:rRNA maturation RNase YbeY [Pelagibacterium halotolerans]|uniref:Endoribonuclease YbeY n=1 Tax=Pelagibacterium halotolerans (strain DSM 22347 / JCM 15775 / CGMCC 1.7692 / B2) TaxID=1082931 RepID=G4R8I8_PELHB|nr:metal-dependent hydrolase [Pelagibacterium halotolerans B2]QJR17001.1 rRNA maturation RNase YbeY [Pelagibacterium halotolerans]SEA61490.1 probable rRNA maturation factor [Pelagibacterium halotolerans]
MTLSVEINIENGDWPETLAPLAERVLTAALENSGFAIDGPCEISVLLTDDASQQALNREWRDKDKPTNVLSFPALDADDAIEGLLGDISLAYETLVAEADELEKPFEHHFAHLLVHGMLHVLGYDHETENEALAMEARETDIMGLLGYPDPYDGQVLLND